MPDVGVLELTIKDNASEAAGGLDSLSRKLANVKNNADGFSLSGVSTQINNLVRNIKATDSTIQRLGTLFNSIANFKKVQGIKFDAQPFRDLKEAIGDGLHIGNAGTQINAIRNAMTGDWGGENANKAIDTMGRLASAGETFVANGTAKAIRDVAKSVQEYVNAIGQVSGGGAHDYLAQQVFPQSAGEAGGIGTNMAAGIREGIESQRDAVITSSVQMVMDAVQAMKQALGIHSPSEVTENEVGAPTARGVVEGLIKTESEVQSAATQVAESAVNAMQEVVGTAANTVSSYFSEELAKAKAELTQWENIYAKTQKQIKYNGSTEERENMLRHAEDGFYASLEKIEQYEKALTDLNEQESEQASLVQQVTSTVQEQAQAMTELASAQAAVKEGWGTGGIAGILNHPDLGSILRGKQGEESQSALIEKISEGTGLSTENIRSQLEQLMEAENQLKTTLDGVAASSNKVSDSFNTDQYIEAYSHVEYLRNSLEDLKREFSIKMSLGMLDKDGIDQYVMKIMKLEEEVNKLDAAQEAAKSSAFSLGGAFSTLKNGIEKMFPGLESLKNRFKSIFTRRAIMYVIRQITAAFKEGTQNVYEYSKAIGSSFAPSMDAAATSINLMKNSIGAMVAPLLQALVPALQTVINWFVNLINYANQFFALLGGATSWTRALPVATEAFNKQKKAAGGAGKAMKDLLADWDELNIIQSQSGGGGGGGGGVAAADYGSMFEQVTSFNETVKDIVDGINDTFGNIWNLVKRIGIAVLGWKFSKAFGAILGTLGGLVGAAVTIGLVFDISTMFTNKYLQTGNVGWLVGDVLTTLVGGVIAKKVLSNVLGGSLSKVAIPLTFAVSAAASLIALVKDTDVSALSERGILTALNTALEGGVAAGSALYYLGGTTAGLAAGYGTGMALFTFGATIGIKAIADTVDAGEITSDILAADFISAGAIGSGLALSQAVIMGTSGTIGSIIGTAAGGALFTLGALLLVEAIISTLPEKIHWGDRHLTEDQVQYFIDHEVFTFDLVANMELAAQKVTLRKEKEEELKTKVRELIPLVDAITLGVDVESSAKKIEELVNKDGGVIDTFKGLQKARKEQLVLSFSSLKIVGEGGEEQDASGLMKQFESGWSMMDTVMSNLGKRMTDALGESYNENIDPKAREMAKETVRAVSEAMMEIQAVTTSNKTEIEMRNMFASGLQDVDQNSMDALLTYFQEQKDAAKKFAEDQYQTVLDEAELQQRSFADLAEIARKNGGEFAGYTVKEYEDMAKKFKDMYDKLTEYRDDSVQAAIDFYKEGGEGYEMLRKAMLELVKGRNITTGASEWEAELFSGEDSVLYGQKAFENVRDIITNNILSAFNQQDRETVKMAISSGILKYTDFINKEMTDEIARNLGITGELKGIWDKYVNELLGLDENGVEVVKPELYVDPNVTMNPDTQWDSPFMEDDDLINLANQANKVLPRAARYARIAAENTYGDDYEVDPVWAQTHSLMTPNTQNIGSYGSYSSGNLDFEVETEGSDPEQDISNISAGVNKGTTDIVTTLNSILTVARMISQKEFKVNVNANADWGFHNNRSNDAAMKVSG